MGSEWSTPANTYRSRISGCTRLVQIILPSFTRRRRTIPTRRWWTSRSQSRDDFWTGNHRNWVQDMDRVFIDGTFTLAPPLFSLVFVCDSCQACRIRVFRDVRSATQQTPRNIWWTIQTYQNDMATFQSNVYLSRLWDGSGEICSTSISTCRTSWMSIPPGEKYEAPVFRERSFATLQCWTTVCPPCQNDSCARVCTNWQFGRRFDALSNQLANELTPILNWADIFLRFKLRVEVSDDEIRSCI